MDRDLSSHSVIAEAWCSLFVGSAGFILSKKLKASKAALKIWNVSHFGHIQHKIKSILAEISNIQCAASSPVLVSREESLQHALQEELIREERLWKQKSRDLWLSMSDLNTKYFHDSTTVRRRSNSINFISIDSGVFLTTRLDIGMQFFGYFQNLYTSSYPMFDAIPFFLRLSRLLKMLIFVVYLRKLKLDVLS